MTRPEIQAGIKAYLQKNPKATGTEIANHLNIHQVQVYGAAAALVTKGELIKSNKTYSLVDMPTVKKAKADKKAKASESVEPAPETTEVEVKEDAATEAPTGKNFGRDFSKFEFEGELLRKGRYIVARMKKLIEGRQDLTRKQLDELFNPTKLVRTHGLYASLTKARQVNAKGKQRYYATRAYIITLGDGAKICMTNQISKDIFPAICEAFAKVDGLPVPNFGEATK